MMKIIRTGQRSSGLLYGSVSVFPPGDPPKYMKVIGVWPDLRFVFSDQCDQVSNKVSTKPNGKQFHVSLAATTLGLPREIRSEDTLNGWTQLGPYEWAFRLAQEEQPSTWDSLLMQGTELLLAWKELCDRFQERFPHTSLSQELGVSVTWEDDEDEGEHEPVEADPVPINFNSERPPNLLFANPRRIEVEGYAVELGWNHLLTAIACLMTEQERRNDKYQLGLVPGKIDKRGYKYIPEIDCSMQSRAANAAWFRTVRAAKALGLTVEVEFEWLHGSRSSHAGQRGIMRIEPTNLPQEPPDTWQKPVEEWIEKLGWDSFTTKDCLQQALGIDPDDSGIVEYRRRLSRVMRAIPEWKSSTNIPQQDGARVRGYVRVEPW